MFLVDSNLPGFHKGSKLNKLGLRGQVKTHIYLSLFAFNQLQSLLKDTAELFFEDLRVPRSALLGKENHGFYYLMDQLPQERVWSFILPLKNLPQIGCANEELARAEAMFELTRDWVRERKAFGKRVADLQTVLRLFMRLSQFFGSIRNSTSSGPTQASRAQDCSHRVQSFLGLVPLIAQQVEAGQRDVEHGQVLGHRP